MLDHFRKEGVHLQGRLLGVLTPKQMELSHNQSNQQGRSFPHQRRHFDFFWQIIASFIMILSLDSANLDIQLFQSENSHSEKTFHFLKYKLHFKES